LQSLVVDKVLAHMGVGIPALVVVAEVVLKEYINLRPPVM
jgi:hypothetical protein